MDKLRHLGALACACVIVVASTASFAQADIVKQRQDNRKQAAAEMRAIKALLDAKKPLEEVKKDGQAIREHGLRLGKLEDAFLQMFPPGSNTGDSKALPAVWSDRAGFEAAGKASASARIRLISAGLFLTVYPDQVEAARREFDALGKACAACHDKYRAKAR